MILHTESFLYDIWPCRRKGRTRLGYGLDDSCVQLPLSLQVSTPMNIINVSRLANSAIPTLVYKSVYKSLSPARQAYTINCPRYSD